jgi:hypothetical protein
MRKQEGHLLLAAKWFSLIISDYNLSKLLQANAFLTKMVW